MRRAAFLLLLALTGIKAILDAHCIKGADDQGEHRHRLYAARAQPHLTQLEKDTIARCAESSKEPASRSG